MHMFNVLIILNLDKFFNNSVTKIFTYEDCKFIVN
jgi:hypothetical protein